MEILKIRAVQIDNLRGFLGIRRNKRAVDDRIDEDVFQWLSNVERMETDRIAKRVYVKEREGSPSLGSPRKRWIDTVKDYLKKRGLDVRQTRRLVLDRSEWQEFVRGNA